MDINIITPVTIDEASQVYDVIELLPAFLDLGANGYEPLYAEAKVMVITDPEEEVVTQRASQERGLAKMQTFLEEDADGSYKLDTGVHQMEYGRKFFWYIVSKYSR